VRDVFDRGGKNCKMTSVDIQKELAKIDFTMVFASYF
jgi:hypothetical protein